MESSLQDLLNKKAKNLERRRKAIFLWARVYRILIVPLKVILRAGVFILAVVCLLFPPFLIYLVICGGAYLLLLIFNDPIKVYEHKLKNSILPDIYKELNPSITYYASSIHRELLQESHLFNQSYFKGEINIEGDDYITGKINNTEVVLNQINIFKEVVDYTKTIGGCLFSIVLFPIYIIKNIFTDFAHQQEIPISGIVKKKIIIHKGLFIKVSLPNKFKGKAIFIPKKIDGEENRISVSFFGKKSIEFQYQNKRINTNYNTYGFTNEEENALLIENIITAINKTEKQLPIVSFINQELYLFIPRDKNLFNINIYEKIKEASFFNPLLKDIEHVNSIIRCLS